VSFIKDCDQHGLQPLSKKLIICESLSSIASLATPMVVDKLPPPADPTPLDAPPSYDVVGPAPSNVRDVKSNTIASSSLSSILPLYTFV